MTARPPELSDADLMAYLDGSLDAARKAEIETYLLGDAETQSRLALWEKQNTQILALYQPVMAESVPARLNVHRIASTHQPARSHWQRLTATALLCLVFGGAGGWLLGWHSAEQATSPEAQGVVQAFAAYRLYSGELLHPVAVEGNIHGHLGIWLSKRLEHKLTIPDLSQEGWQLLGGSILPASGKAAAQIMYQDADGRRLTLFLIPTYREGGSTPRFMTAGTLNALTWNDSGLNCTIVGQIDHQEMTWISGIVYNQM